MEKAIAGGVMVLMLTTLVLPQRQTPAIIEKIGNAVPKITNSLIGR